MLPKTNDVKGDIEDAIVRTTKKDEVEEETTDDAGLNQKMSTAPATPDDIETTTMTGASTDTGRDTGTTHDENVATAPRDHPGTNDAGGQKAAAPARHRPGKPAGPYHPKTNPTAATPASKADAPTPPAVLHPRPNRNPTTNPRASSPKKPTPSPAPPKSSNTTNRPKRGNLRPRNNGACTCSKRKTWPIRSTYTSAASGS